MKRAVEFKGERQGLNIDIARLKEYLVGNKGKLSNLRDHGWIEDAYHGTSSDEAQSILSEGFRSPSRPGYFGRAIYFVESNPQTAIVFVSTTRRDVSSIAVLECAVQAKKTLLYNDIAEIASQLKQMAEDRTRTVIRWEDFGTALFLTLRTLGLDFQSVVWHTDKFVRKNIAVVLAVYDPKHAKARRIHTTEKAVRNWPG